MSTCWLTQYLKAKKRATTTSSSSLFFILIFSSFLSCFVSFIGWELGSSRYELYLFLKLLYCLCWLVYLKMKGLVLWPGRENHSHAPFARNHRASPNAKRICVGQSRGSDRSVSNLGSCMRICMVLLLHPHGSCVEPGSHRFLSDKPLALHVSHELLVNRSKPSCFCICIREWKVASVPPW